MSDAQSTEFVVRCTSGGAQPPRIEVLARLRSGTATVATWEPRGGLWEASVVSQAVDTLWDCVLAHLATSTGVQLRLPD
jgi:hypothetical protein